MKRSHFRVVAATLLLASASATADTMPEPKLPAEPAPEPAPAPFDPLMHLADPSPTSRITAALVVRVEDPEAVMKRLIQEAVEAGGYLLSRDDYSITLRVPRLKVADYLNGVAMTGRVSERSYEVSDHARELATLNARLQTRHEVLQRYLIVMNTADTEGVLAVEREVQRLIAEIEQLTGSRRLLENQLDLGQIVVSFRFADRQTPETSPTSSFGWINSLNLQGLQGEYR